MSEGLALIMDVSGGGQWVGPKWAWHTSEHGAPKICPGMDFGIVSRCVRR
jgi:hypothetical protein